MTGKELLDLLQSNDECLDQEVIIVANDMDFNLDDYEISEKQLIMYTSIIEEDDNEEPFEEDELDDDDYDEDEPTSDIEE